jgi:3-deoxy-D-manno-octulosonic-acid transferase
MRVMKFLPACWAGVTRLAAPLLRQQLRRRARRGKEIFSRLPERHGIDPTPRPPGRLIWLHAASVGETMSILPVLIEFSTRAPDAHVLLTTGTVTSAALLAERLPALGIHNHVIHRFVPLDVPLWVTRFLDHWRPDVAGFVESELWPNLLAGCRRRGVPLVLINARLSPRSFSCWRRVPSLARHVLEGVTEVQPQSEADAARFRALGAPCVRASKDLKLAAPPLPVDAAELARLRAALSGRPVWVAASTHPPEDSLIRAAHRLLAPHHPGLLTILVPRHPDRGAAIAAATKDISVARRAAGEEPPPTGIWVADTLGELGLFYRLAGIAFVGRSLVAPGGGQNPLEPAKLGCAVAVGRHTGNFAAAVAMLEAEGALARVTDATELAAWVDAMLRDPERRAAMARAGKAACNRGAELPGLVAARLLSLASAQP